VELAKAEGMELQLATDDHQLTFHDCSAQKHSPGVYVTLLLARCATIAIGFRGALIARRDAFCLP